MAQHLNRLLTEMVKEEEAMKGRLLANVEKYGHDVIRLSKELQMPAAEVSTVYVYKQHINRPHLIA